MPKGPAARLGDTVAHAPPGVLAGSGSPTVLIGKKPAWRGVGGAMVGAIQAAKATADAAIQAAEAATLAAAGTPGAPAAKAAEEAIKASTAASMSSSMSGFVSGSISAAGAVPDIHTCGMPLPVPPHGPGLVIDGSKTVFINGLPACRQGDTIVEAVGPPNKVTAGDPTVIIGG